MLRLVVNEQKEDVPPIEEGINIFRKIRSLTHEALEVLKLMVNEPGYTPTDFTALGELRQAELVNESNKVHDAAIVLLRKDDVVTYDDVLKLARKEGYKEEYEPPRFLRRH